MKNDIAEIARLNDEFRSRLTEGNVVLHRTVRHWSRACEVLDGLRVVPGLVPGGADEPLRDTGSLRVAGKRIVWKIHYYDQLGRFRCRPLDRDCLRVLTAMFASGFRGSASQFWRALERKALTKEIICQQPLMNMRQRLRERMMSSVVPAGE
jgi:hypothetical protein